MSPFMLLIACAITLLLGTAAGYYLRYLHAHSKKSSIEITLKARLLDAESAALKIIEKAEEKAAQQAQHVAAAQQNAQKQQPKAPSATVAA